MAAPGRLTAGESPGPARRHQSSSQPGSAGGADVSRRRGGGRAARALAGAGVLFVLTGAGLLSAGPSRAPDIGASPGARPEPVSAPAAVAAPALQSALTAWLPAADPVPPAPPPAVPAAPAAPGTVPVELVLPARAVRAPVVAVSTGANGALLVPDPPSTVGWWSPSALPGGAAGTTVIAGHVDSAAHGLGALAALRQVVTGEEIVLTGADGRVIGYRVTSRRQYAKAELPVEVFAVGGPPRLVLITCGGEFDRRTRHYTDNVVVYAEPV